MNNSARTVIRFLQRLLALALKNPRTTAAGIAGIIAGSKLIWQGQHEIGIASVLTGLVGVLGADAVTVSRHGDRIEQNAQQIDDATDGKN